MSSFISEINKLKNIQQNMEKNGSTFIGNYSKSNQHMDLLDLRSESSKFRKMQQSKLNKDLTNIMNPLKKINDSLKKKNLDNLDVKTVTTEMTDAQTNMRNLNDSAQATIEDLKKDEQFLFNDLQNFQQKLDKWEKRCTVVTPKPTRTISTPENISKEAKVFMEFVANTGGHENGWNTEDHRLFLRVRNKVKDVNKIAEIVHSMLPDISEKEVKAHEVWYIKYLELKEKQKNSIKNWRETRAKAQNTPPLYNSPEKAISKNYCVDDSQKELIHNRLKVWKKEKLLQSKYEYEQKIQEFVKQRELEQAKKHKQEVVRAQVNSWKNLRKTVEEEEKLRKEEEQQREKRERAAKAKKLIKEFQSQDDMFIQQKLQLMQVQNKLPPINPPKNRGEKIRERSTLLQPTQQWIMRRYAGPDKDNYLNNMNINTVPKLRMPEWRKCIM